VGSFTMVCKEAK